METRNIAIIAHVDHGKTTLTDAIMRRTGMFQEGMSMDANAIERVHGHTLLEHAGAAHDGVGEGRLAVVDVGDDRDVSGFHGRKWWRAPL